MSEPITLTQAATAAAQFLGVLDSGETLSNQQLTDALNAANNILSSWTNEQTEALQVLVNQQNKDLQLFIDKLIRDTAPQVTSYTLSAAVYTIPTFTNGVITPGALLQFPDLVTAINVPNGYSRALKLALAIEIGPQYDVQPSAALVSQLKEARAAANPMPGQRPIPGMPGASPAEAQEAPAS